MSQVLLVEDDQALGETLKERLELEGHQAVWVEGIDEATRLLDSEIFDLAVLDIGIVGGSGLDLATEIKTRYNVPFIFVTAQTSAEVRLKGYELGAEEFIPKPFHLKEFLIRVRHVLKNHSRPKVIDLGGATLHSETMSIESVQGKMMALTKTEYGVLSLLVRRSPAVVSRDDISDEVWGDESDPSPRTIDNVVAKLRSILASPISDKLQSVRGVGYQWKGK